MRDPRITKRQDFNVYADLWKDQTRFLSNTAAMKDNPFFRAMVMLGDEVVPWAMLRLKDDVFFHLVLEILVGHKDFQANGVMQKIQDGWLKWGREMGLLPLDG